MATIRITTGDNNLDNLLSPDRDVAHSGIECSTTGTESREAPVLLILGAAGTGKTALSLQIANATAEANDHCCVFLYSLEQSKASLQRAATAFSLSTIANDKLFVDLQDSGDEVNFEPKRVYLVHFPPLPLSTRESTTAFENRFLQVCHLIEKLREGRHGALAPIFVIDSLNAISTSAPERTDIYRLFSVFRLQGIPLVMTAERQELGISATTSVSEAARFLADLVIELTKDVSTGHLLQYLEISKSRIQRQSLGYHLYKIRTVREGFQGGNGGIQVYRSMPCVISTIRPERKQHEQDEYRLHDETGEEDLRLLYPKPTTNAGHCFALLGPPGTHKLAVALNLAGGYRTHVGANNALQKYRNLLIISFGGSATNLKEIAWFKGREFWRHCPPLQGEESAKWWWASSAPNQELGAVEDGEPVSRAVQLTFRLGHLTPEECFDCIDKGTRPNNGLFSAVVLSDTAEICTGFPLLKRDPLFIPALVDLFRIRGLTSFGIGVQSDNSQNREMDFTLQSCADCRLYFTHYPGAYDLAKRTIHPDTADGTTPQLEQSVSVIADIVAGRVYERHPHWLWIDGKWIDGNRTEPTLHCGTYDKYRDWVKVHSHATPG